MEQVNTNEIPLPPSPPPKSCESHVDTTEQNLVSTPSEELLTEEIQEFQPTSASSSPSVALATSVSSCDSLTSTELDSHSQTRSLNELSNSPKPLGILLLHPTSTPLPRSVSTPSVSVSVTFAPLPTLDPRRRTSSVQLGVAARSQMLRARRTRVMGDTIEGVQHIPGEGISHVQYTAVQDHQQQQTQEQSTYQRPQRQRYQKRQSYVWQEDEDPERARGTSSRRPSVPKWGPTAGDSGDEMDEQDALLALGRMVRGGAKSLWRSFSQGSVKDRLRESTGGEGVENGPHSDETEIETEIVGRGRLSGRRNSSDPGRQSDLEQSVTLRVLVKEPRNLFEGKTKALEAIEEPLAAPAKSEEEEEEGKVWDEEVDDDALRRRMQTVLAARDDEKGKNGMTGRLASLRLSIAAKPKAR